MSDLWLKGNPIFKSNTYRQDVYKWILLQNDHRGKERALLFVCLMTNVLSDSVELKLDGKGISKREYDELKALEKQTPEKVLRSPPVSMELSKEKKKKKGVVTVEPPLVKGKKRETKAVSPIASFSEDLGKRKREYRGERE